MNICKIENCENNAHCKGFCQKHYYQMSRYGEILERTLSDPNRIYYKDGLCLIEFYNKNNEVSGNIIVDEDNIELLSKYKWYCSNYGYIVSRKKTKVKGNILLMHQLLIGKKKGFVVKHINKNKLDNRICNLKHVSYSISNHSRSIDKNNTTGVRGVHYLKNSKKWKVRISVNKRHIYLGLFTNIKEAINARIQAEKKYYGEIMKI